MTPEQEERLRNVENFIDSIKSFSNFPQEVVEAMIGRGFVNVLKEYSLKDYTGTNYLRAHARYLNTGRVFSVARTPYSIKVKSVTGNTFVIVDSNSPNLPSLNGKLVQIYTDPDGTYPTGMTSDLVFIINPTNETFQISDIFPFGTPIDITDEGVGNLYMQVFDN